MESILNIHLYTMKFIKLSFLALTVVIALLFTLIILYYYPYGKSALKLRLYRQCTSLAKARSLAENDFQNGDYILIGYLGNESHLRHVADSLIEKRYGIQMMNMGCVGVSEEEYEYSNRMAELLATKFGRDFYDEIVEEARVLAGTGQTKELSSDQFLSRG